MVARDTKESVKGNQTMDDSKFTQGPINLASMSPIEKLQLATFAQAKASEDFMKSHIEDSEMLSQASGILEKIMPSFQKDALDTPSIQLRSLIKSVDTHFESLEKSTEEKVYSEFNAKRMRTFNRMIVGDKVILDTCIKRIPDALTTGGNIYKSCLSLSNFTERLRKSIRSMKSSWQVYLGPFIL